MTIDRRSFLYAGGLSAAAASPFALAAHAASPPEPNLADLGVQPDAERDQTQALQNAINRLAGNGKPIIFPPGKFIATTLVIPGPATLIGLGRTDLRVREIVVKGTGDADAGDFTLSGLTFRRTLDSAAAVQLSIDGLQVKISDCTFMGLSAGRAAIKLTNCGGSIQRVVIGHTANGIIGTSSSLTVTDCQFVECASAVMLSSKKPSIVMQNKVVGGDVGIAVDGSAIVSNNHVESSNKFGLKLGRAGNDGGNIVAQSNILDNCRIGVGVSASGDDVMVALNMITQARDGAIRAFDGDKLVGPDLAKQSAESYLNLMVAGNLVR
jgi:Pectate lyase superfamily protein